MKWLIVMPETSVVYIWMPLVLTHCIHDKKGGLMVSFSQILKGILDQSRAFALLHGGSEDDDDF